MREAIRAELSWQLDSVSTRQDYLQAVGQLLLRIIPSDLLGWTGVHLVTREAEIEEATGPTTPEIVAALARSIPTHPMLVSYLGQPGLAPRRMSDLVPTRDWRRHPVRNDLFRLMGTDFQVSLLLPSVGGVRWHGFAFNRADSDFSDDEVETMAELQPVLTALNKAACYAWPVAVVAGSEASERLGMTSREGDALRLLAAGLSPSEIATMWRVSTRTVGKHVENLYRKLGCHDRVNAILRGRALGLLDDADAPSSNSGS